LGACASNTDGHGVVPNNAQLSDIRAGPVVAVVERGPGQPGIEGLANIGMQPTAAPWHHWRRRGS
jgi:hypothetical protein